MKTSSRYPRASPRAQSLPNRRALKASLKGCWARLRHPAYGSPSYLCGLGHPPESPDRGGCCLMPASERERSWCRTFPMSKAKRRSRYDSFMAELMSLRSRLGRSLLLVQCPAPLHSLVRRVQPYKSRARAETLGRYPVHRLDALANREVDTRSYPRSRGRCFRPSDEIHNLVALGAHYRKDGRGHLIVMSSACQGA